MAPIITTITASTIAISSEAMCLLPVWQTIASITIIIPIITVIALLLLLLLLLLSLLQLLLMVVIIIDDDISSNSNSSSNDNYHCDKLLPFCHLYHASLFFEVQLVNASCHGCVEMGIHKTPAQAERCVDNANNHALFW